MPRYDDDMQRRREKREALRKKREAEARRMKRRLLLAAGALALVVAGIFYLATRPAPDETEAAVQTVAQTQPPAETAVTSPLQQSPITTIHIKAAGDLNVTDSVIRSGLSVNGYNFNNAFRDVAALLADADLTVLNFEGNIYGAPYGTETTRPSARRGWNPWGPTPPTASSSSPRATPSPRSRGSKSPSWLSPRAWADGLCPPAVKTW